MQESATTPNTDKFFSISAEDTPQNSPSHQSNANPHPPRTRRLSNSSQASDVSFKLPDAGPSYHFSDMESASEIDESAPTQLGQLDLVSKEQLHQAYKKALERYQKYRGLYTDLARKFKELERDNTKTRSVLVDTQEKALRRINELREQCSLEQQAKAHLEASLRLEMDEMQCVIKTLTTKLNLPGETPPKPNELLIELASADHAESGVESSSDQNSQSENELHDLREKETNIAALNTKIEQLQAQLSEMSAKEETNAVSILRIRWLFTRSSRQRKRS